MSALTSWTAVERIALTRASDGLGSLVLARPALAAVRRMFPDAQISTVGPASGSTIVADLGVSVLPRDEAPAADLGIDIDAPGPRRRSREHVTDRYVRVLGGQLGTTPIPEALDLRSQVPHARRHGAIIVHATSRAPSRRWSGYAPVCRTLLERGFRVILVGVAADRPAIAQVARDGGVAAEDCLAGRTDLPALMRLIAGSPLVVSGDTAVGHLATALGVPSVRMMLRTAAQDRAPKSGPHSILRNRHIDEIAPGAVVESCLMRLDRGV